MPPRGLEGALGVYGGPLLDGFIPTRLREFLDWVDLERRRLSELARRAAMELSTRSAGESGDPGTAISWARWALRQAPFDEAGLRHLLRLLADSGQASTAVREYRRFRTRLKAELDLDPDPATIALVRAIRRDGGGRMSA